MAKTINDAHLSLAYRLGGSTVPTAAADLAMRLDWFRTAINLVCAGEEPLWFMQGYTTMATAADVQDYTLPTDFRKMFRLKVDGYKYEEIDYEEVYRRYEQPNSVVPILPAYMARAYYVWGGKYNLIPIPSAAPTAVTPTSITSSTTTCTVTATAHGLTNDDYVVVAGADQTAYNGTFQITVLTADTFSYTALTTPAASPATGTITYAKNNIQLWYYKLPTEPTGTNSSIVVPDEYMDLLVAYAEGRYWSFAHKRGKAADAFAEYEKRLADLKKEDFRRKYHAT